MLLVLASRVQSFGFKLLGENKLSLVSTRDCLLDTESRSHILIAQSSPGEGFGFRGSRAMNMTARSFVALGRRKNNELS